MDRRRFFREFSLSAAVLFTLNGGCRRGHQYAHVLKGTDRDMVGSHAAGAETWEPLIQTTVNKLLSRQMQDVQLASHDGQPCKKRICFLNVDNRGAEELGDAGDQIYQKIDTIINESDVFELVSRRAVESGLQQCGLRPDDLFTPNARRKFAGIMEKEEAPIDYLLYATVTSLTTRSNKDSQRNYDLTLELVNIKSGHSDKETAEIRKGYHKSVIGKLRQYGRD